MLSRQEEEQERRETFDNDLKVLREQGSTFHQHGIAQADEIGGRFAAVSAAKVVGQSPGIAASYPAASAHQSDPCGPEPPLGIDVNQLTPYELEPSLNPVDPGPSSSSAQHLGAPAGAASPSVPQPPLFDGVDQASDAGAPSSSQTMAARREWQMASADPLAADVGAERPPARPNPWRWRK